MGEGSSDSESVKKSEDAVSLARTGAGAHRLAVIAFAIIVFCEMQENPRPTCRHLRQRSGHQTRWLFSSFETLLAIWKLNFGPDVAISVLDLALIACNMIWIASHHP